VRGLPTALNQIPSTGMIKFYNHLAAKDLQNEIQKAEWVIGRCGYSTVMDIMKLHKKSILIPTPGQTEQEYLAQHLLQNQFAFCVSQKKFSVVDALQQASKFDFKYHCFEEGRLKSVVKNFMNGI
jgi:predicted glycosyltransferase